jgi:N-acetyl-anhydromuramyl-L-alanine amidase AmpD
MRPDFNEYPMWSPNNQDRNGTKIDLFLLHTQEGAGNADSLARYLGNPANRVSYHYTVSQDAKDNGVTVVDVVDTDLAAWSALSANNRSINLCFAGSSVKWSTETWMQNAKAIDTAAWLAVQDCKKYGIPFTVIAPPYTARAGITDHNYVTKVLKDGTHSDVGPNFPWPYFAGKVAEYSGATPVPPPVTPTKVYPKDFTDRELLEDLWRKVSTLVKP